MQVVGGKGKKSAPTHPVKVPSNLKARSTAPRRQLVLVLAVKNNRNEAISGTAPATHAIPFSAAPYFTSAAQLDDDEGNQTTLRVLGRHNPRRRLPTLVRPRDGWDFGIWIWM